MFCDAHNFSRRVLRQKTQARCAVKLFLASFATKTRAQCAARSLFDVLRPKTRVRSSLRCTVNCVSTCFATENARATRCKFFSTRFANNYARDAVFNLFSTRFATKNARVMHCEIFLGALCDRKRTHDALQKIFFDAFCDRRRACDGPFFFLDAFLRTKIRLRLDARLSSTRFATENARVIPCKNVSRRVLRRKMRAQCAAKFFMSRFAT